MALGVRARVTAVAVAVTAVALALGGWGLVRSIERTQLGRVAAAADQRVDEVVSRLAAGADPAQVAVAYGMESGVFVQVTRDGNVLSATPGVATSPVLMGTPYGAGAVTMEGGFSLPAPTRISYRTVQTPSGQLTVVAGSPLDEVRQSIDDVRRSLLFGLPFVAVLVGIITWVVAGRALRPVEAIRAEVDAISHSTLHRRVPVPATSDEVSRLARTMNDMLDRLERSAERQQRFVADASHELRSPVAALRTELEVALLSGGEDAGALRAAAEGALAEEARIEALLADLLLLASVEEAPAATDDVDLAAVAAAVAVAPRRVPVSVAGAGRAPGTAGRIERAVANLVDNAARHATTAVSVTVEDGRVTVDDDGPGIPVEDRSRVFERFTRLDEARTRDAGGAGLGRSIVAAVAAAGGGSVRIEDAPAGGARVVLDLGVSRR